MFWNKKKPEVKQQQLEVKSVSLPEVTPRWKLNTQSKGNRLDWCVKTAIKEGYDTSIVTFACIEKRAKLAASVPWVAYKKQGDELVKAENSPLQLLISNPNPEQSFNDIIHASVQQLDVAGDAFISEIKAGAGNLPVELWVLPSENMVIQQSIEALVSAYHYVDSNVKRVIDANDICRLTFTNPNNTPYGMPTMKAAAMSIDTDVEAQRFQKVSFQNRGLSDISVKLPEGTTIEQADHVREKIKEKQAGSSNAREPFVSTGDIKALNQSAAEMDFVNSRKTLWAEICAAFGLSLSVLGMTEDVNLANGKEQQKALWVNTIIPLLDVICAQINRQLVSEFGDEYVLKYDLSNVSALQQDINEKLDAAKKLFDLGLPMTLINQRLELGFDEKDLSPESFLPMGYTPVSMMGEEEDEEIDNEDEESNIKLAYGG